MKNETKKVELSEVVTVGGWYPTKDGRWAEVVWVNGLTRIGRVADQVPTAEEEDARVRKESAEYEAWKAARQ